MIAQLTKPTKKGYRLGRSFMELIQRFPLLAIRDEAEYDRATAVLQDLTGRDDLDEDQDRYLDAVGDLIRDYEEDHYDFDSIPVSSIDALKHLLKVNDMNVSDLGRVIGSQPTASMILSGKRQISKDNARKLAERFKVDSGLFIFATVDR